MEEPSKSAKIADKDKNPGRIHGNSSAETPSVKRARSNSPEEGQDPKIEDQVSLKKNKSGNLKNRRGKIVFEGDLSPCACQKI